MYAIFGATGSIGKALAAEFARAGKRFRVVGRSEEHLRQTFSRYGDLVDYRVADFQDPQVTANAADGVDTIFYLAGVPYTRFALHPKLTRGALDAAKAGGVERFVHVSTVYPYGVPQTELVDESHPRNPHTFKGHMRKEQEDLVLGAHGCNGLQTVILRPPDFYGPGAELSFATDIFKAALESRTANVVGPVDTPHEFIFVPDVAKTLMALSHTPDAYGSAWNVGGPGLITTRRFAELVFAQVGQKPRLRAANKMMLRILGLFNPIMREMVEMHYLWTSPVKLDDRRLRALLPDLQKTSYEDGIRQTIEALRARKAA